MSETIQDKQAGDYRVDLEVFDGPLDLLLHLIKMEEVEIYEIPIARITKQYLRYVDMMEHLDLEVAGEFILMAATLIRIKTKLLLPREENDPDEPDAREELIMALVEYKKYKEAGEILRERALMEEQHYVPMAAVEKVEGRVDITPATGIYELVVAYWQVVSSQAPVTVHEVAAMQVTIEERMRYVIQMVLQQGATTYGALFADQPNRAVAVVTFVALLELARTQRLRLDQSVAFSELRVYPGDAISAPLRKNDLVDYAALEEQGVAS